MLDVAALRRFVATQEQHIEQLPATGEIDPVTGTGMYPYFGDTFSDRLAIAEVAQLCGSDAVDDPGSADFVFHARKPFVEDFRAKEGIHFH
jgi:hypothetical protein